MADPVTMAVVSLGATALSAGVGAIGAEKSAEAQQASANYQAQVAENNATTARQNAQYATQAAQVNAQNTDLQTRQTLGKELAGASASGLDPTTGSPVDVRTGTREIGRLTSLEDIQKGNLTAYGYQTTATSDIAQAGLDRATGAFARQAGDIGAASSLLQGVSGFSTKWAGFQDRGTLPGGGGDSGILTPGVGGAFATSPFSGGY